MTKKWWTIALVTLIACQEPYEVEVVSVPSVLFEIEVTNFAFVPVWKGFYMDAGGTIWSYDRSDELPDPGGERPELTHDELMLKFQRPARVRDIPLADFFPIYELIPAAAQGSITPAQTKCADAGQLRFRAFLFNQLTRRYRPVSLRTEGDIIQTNTAPEAQRIYNWLDSLRLVQHITGCEPS